MKRPVILFKDLSQEDIKSLCNYSEEFKSRYKGLYNNPTQIFVYKSGRLGFINYDTVYVEFEVICTTYQEFLTKWGEYRLWLILQNTQ